MSDPDRAEPTRRTLADDLAFTPQWATEPAKAGPSSPNLPGDSR